MASNFNSLSISLLELRDECFEMCKSTFYSDRSKRKLRNVANALMQVYCYVTCDGDLPKELFDNVKFKNL